MTYRKNRYITTALAFLAIIVAILSLVAENSNLIKSVQIYYDHINPEIILASLQITLALLSLVISIFVGLGSVFFKHKLDRIRDKKQIFIAYSRKDSDKAKEIYEYLKKNDLKPWIDSEDIFPGDKWQIVIENAIEESSAVLVLVSNTSSSDTEGYISKEIKKSLSVAQIENETLSPIIPVRLSNTPLPEELSNIQSIDYFEENKNLDRLLVGLRRVLKIT